MYLISKNHLKMIFIFWWGLALAQEKNINLQELKEISQTENKSILIKFSGSDWCIPCIKLQKKIIEDPKFQEYLSNNLLFVDADFPRKKNKISLETKNRNKELAEHYNPNGIFPLMVLVNKEGKILKKWEGFDDYTALDLIKELNFFSTL